MFFATGLTYDLSNASSADYRNSITGWGYGFGTKHKIDKNLFVNLEVQQIGYEAYIPGASVSSQSISHTTTLGTIGLGYQF